MLYLDDLIESAEKIGRFISRHTADSIRMDEAVFDAVLFNLQIIGEAVKRLPDDVRAKLPDAGAGPARLRDLIAHHYFAIDSDIVWEVATTHVPSLLQQAHQLRSEAEVRNLGDLP
ncbi:MAG: DUF86 domain-containing protein [Gammaproteobacteria bacterium]